MNFLIAAGGTGGHITPGIAIGTMLKQKGHKVEFVGTMKGMEVDLIPKAGFKIKYIHAEGLKGGLVQNFRAILTLIKGIEDCKKIIKEYKPDMVIGTGGYVTAPLIMAGNLLKIPTMIHESNALPGKTTKLLSKTTSIIAVGFETAKQRLNNRKNVVCTGNPNKMNLNQMTKKEAKEKLEIKNKMILVFGGSQGAQKINETMIELIRDNSIDDAEVIYATGPRNYESIISRIIRIPKNVKIKKYIYNMEEVMKAADLVICRSGALTVSEISAVGVASILIPFPYAAENHQFYNAKTLKDVRAAEIIQEEDLTPENLLSVLQEICKDDNLLEQMGKNAKKIETKDPLNKIQSAIEKVLGKSL